MKKVRPRFIQNLHWKRGRESFYKEIAFFLLPTKKLRQRWLLCLGFFPFLQDSCGLLKNTVFYDLSTRFSCCFFKLDFCAQIRSESSPDSLLSCYHHSALVLWFDKPGAHPERTLGPGLLGKPVKKKELKDSLHKNIEQCGNIKWYGSKWELDKFCVVVKLGREKRNPPPNLGLDSTPRAKWNRFPDATIIIQKQEKAVLIQQRKVGWN